MPKTKNKFIYTVYEWLISHPWLKLIALVLAIMVWFYVKEEISKFNLNIW